MGNMKIFNDSNFKQICDELAFRDADLKLILDNHGYPPLWKRSPTFETLVHIILEQQVSLASALAALNKLKEKIGDINPAHFMALTNEDLRNCYFSRQKIIYTQHLAKAMIDKTLKLDTLVEMDNDGIRSTLTKIKGIGNWTVDVYLMMVLQRSDLFPLSDVALMTSVRETKNLSKEITREAIASIATDWKPYQTVAAFILWHGYLSKRRRIS